VQHWRHLLTPGTKVRCPGHEGLAATSMWGLSLAHDALGAAQIAAFNFEIPLK
jgi:hypothetical protein